MISRYTCLDDQPALLALQRKLGDIRGVCTFSVTGWGHGAWSVQGMHSKDVEPGSSADQGGSKASCRSYTHTRLAAKLGP